MLTDFEKYLVLQGIHIRETDRKKEDRIADEMDELWHRLSGYQMGIAREAGRFGLEMAEKIDGVTT